MFDIAAGTFDAEDDIFNETEMTIKRHRRFLEWASVFAGKAAADKGVSTSIMVLSLSGDALPTDRGIRVQFDDSRWIEIFAHEDTFCVRRSCGFHFAAPWRVQDWETREHVKKAIRGFFVHK